MPALFAAPARRRATPIPAAILAFVLLSYGCAASRGDASSGTGHAPSAGASSGVCWPVTALRLDALEHGAEWEPIVTLEADGTFVRGHKRVAKLENDRLLLANDPLTCDSTFVVRTSSASHAAHHDADDALVMENTRIFVRDDGEVEMTTNGAVVFGGKRRSRVVGDITHARRSAELLVLVALASAKY